MNTTQIIEDGTEVIYRRPGAQEFSGTIVSADPARRGCSLVRKVDGTVVSCDDDHLWEELEPTDQREAFARCY